MYSPSRYRSRGTTSAYGGSASGMVYSNGYSNGYSSSSNNGYSNGYLHHQHDTSTSYLSSSGSSGSSRRSGSGPGYSSPYLSDSSSRYAVPRRTSASSLPPLASSKRTMSSSPTPSSATLTSSRRAPSLSKRSMSLSPSRIDEFKLRESLTPVRAMIRDSFSEDSTSLGGGAISGSGRGLNGGGDRSNRLKSPSVSRERTRDDLIDSIIYTRTRENRVMPGMLSTTDWNERRALRIDCDKVYHGIILGNGDTIKNVDYLRGIGVTHVLNTAERHVPVNPDKYPLNGISYYGFHVDDHPSANISRYFARTTEFIDEAIRSKGLIVVNCVMGWSRSATVVAAYLMMRKGMTSSEALETIRQSRPIRPNPGFLQQLADHENLLNKKLVWS